MTNIATRLEDPLANQQTSRCSYDEPADVAFLDPPFDSVDTYPQLRRILIVGDAVSAALAWALPSLTPGSLLAGRLAHGSFVPICLSVITLVGCTALTLVMLATERLYLARVCSMRTVEIARIGRTSLTLGLAALLVAKLSGEEHLARVPVLTAVLTFILLNLWRAGYSTWISDARRQGRYTRSVILVGANDEAYGLFQHLRRHVELGYEVKGIIGRVEDARKHPFDVPWMGEMPTLPEAFDRTGIKGAIVAGGALGRPQLNVAIRQLLERQVHVHMSTGINGIDHRRMRSHSLAYEPMVYVERADLDGWQISVKRVMDIVIAGFLLVLSCPLLLVAGAAVKLHDHGPVFFRQERVGRNGKRFTILKFRSMVSDAETKLVDLQDQNVRQGPLFKLAEDPRVTRIGWLLRATSIDELPQLINVLRGDMSLVGPRPALPSEVAEFDTQLMARQNVMPGITGLWQVEGRDNPDFTLYQRLDLFYVENWCVTLDMSILFSTAKVVAMRIARSVSQRKNQKVTNDVDGSRHGSLNTVVLD